MAQTLTISAREVVKQRFDAAAYPYRHLAVSQTGKIGTAEAQIPVVMAAVEILGLAGWELVAFSMAPRTVTAAMRRPEGPPSMPAGG